MKLPWEDGYESIDLTSAVLVPMNHEHDKLGFGQDVPGKFRKELVDLGIKDTFEAIKRGYRTATTRVEKYKRGQIFIFYKRGLEEKLVCRAICDSYPLSDVTDEEWGLLEGWESNYLTLNPLARNKFQVKFKYIKSICQ